MIPKAERLVSLHSGESFLRPQFVTKSEQTWELILRGFSRIPEAQSRTRRGGPASVNIRNLSGIRNRRNYDKRAASTGISHFPDLPPVFLLLRSIALIIPQLFEKWMTFVTRLT